MHSVKLRSSAGPPAFAAGRTALLSGSEDESGALAVVLSTGCSGIMLTLPELLGAAVVAGRAALPELLETAGAKKRFMAPRCKQNLEPILSSRGDKLNNSL